MQLSRERLFFHSASAAIALAIVSRLLTIAIAELMPTMAGWIKSYIFPWPLTGTAFLAFLLGPIIALVLNSLIDKEESNIKAISKLGDLLERTLLSATENDDLVIFSMKSKKVYVGLVVEIPANLDGKSSWLTIVPYFSGYRDPETQEIVLTTEYLDVIEEYTIRTEDSDDETSNSKDMFVRTIRTEEIEVCGVFIPEIWERFQNTSVP